MKAAWSMALLIVLSLASFAQGASRTVSDPFTIDGMEYAVVMDMQTRVQLRTGLGVATKPADLSPQNLQNAVDELGRTVQNSFAQILGPLKDLQTGSTDYPHILLGVVEEIRSQVQSLSSNLAGSGAVVNFMVVPWNYGGPTADPFPGMDDQDGADFARTLSENFIAVKKYSLGPTSSGKLPVYLLGAVISVVLDGKNCKVTGQLALGLNPYQYDLPKRSGTMTFKIPDTLQVASNPWPTMAPSVAVSVQEDLTALTYPQIHFQFGNVRTLVREKGTYHFDVSLGTLCEYVYMTPRVEHADGPLGIPLNVYIKDVVLDTQTGRIVKSSAGAAVVHVGGCIGGNYVSRTFTDRANQIIADKVTAIEDGLFSLLNSTPEDFLKIIERQRAGSPLFNSNAHP